MYVLSRMGNLRGALALIIEARADIPRAIEFVRCQRDEELWEELISWALRSADTTGARGSTAACSLLATACGLRCAACAGVACRRVHTCLPAHSLACGSFDAAVTPPMLAGCSNASQ